MNVRAAIDDDFETIDRSATVGKIRGAFTDPTIKALPVINEEQILGIVTRRDVLSSRESPSRKAGSLARSVPRISEDTDVREAARLMITGDTPLLPIVDDDEIVGVLRADDLLHQVRDSLDALEGIDVATTDLVSIPVDTELGRTLAMFRENGIRHLPVVSTDQSEVVGIASLHDVLAFSTRSVTRTQGGDPNDAMLGPGEGHFGGYGSREGESENLLELPVSNVMATPVITASPDQTLDRLVEEMIEHNSSSVVLVEDDDVAGIVTKTDILESLTWSDEQPYYIHVFGSERMVEMSWEDLSDQIEGVVKKDRQLRLLEAKVHFHHHKESLRGRPLVLARIRLFTDNGMFIGSGEGFGDRHAFSVALDVIERQLLDEKSPTRAERSGDHLNREGWEPGQSTID